MIEGDPPVQDALSRLLALSPADKAARGLVDTPREIHQQPETWRETVNLLKRREAEIRAYLEACGIRPGSRDQPAVVLAGAGTSDYIGRAVSRVLRQRWQCEVHAVPSTELLTNLADFVLPGRRYLFVSFSRSGESSEGVALLELAAKLYPREVRHLIVTCNAESSMAAQADAMAVVLSDAVNDRGLAMTSSFTNMVIAGQYLAHLHTPEAYEPIAESLVAMGRIFLPQAADAAAELSRHGFERVCFLGTGALQAVAEESSLKVLELNAGKLPTIAESFLGVRHGPLSFVNQETLVVASLSGDPHRRRYEMDLLQELRQKRLAGQTLVIAPQLSTEIEAVADRVISLEAPEGFPDDCRPPVDIVMGQMLGLFFSLANDIRPDTPSQQEAISRVVSHVKIYSPA